MPNTLAAVILTKNAEPQIDTCLKSIAGWADEIIIVDGQSTDQTLSICRHYTDKIFIKPFEGSFSQDRNFGATQATADWILQLDADEIVPETFKKKFEEIRNISSFYAYKTWRKNFFLGKCMDKGPWYHLIQILYLKKHAQFFGLVHERLKVDNDNVGILDADIEHHPFSSIEQFLNRHNRYTTLAAKELYETKGILPDSYIRKQLFYKSFKFFWKLFIIKKGYKEGMVGLIFSLLFSFEHFLKWVKYWELVQKQKKHGT